MRDFKGMKRQRSRNRSGGGGGKPQHNANRAFDSNGPEGVKVRGAAQHVYERYQQLARDAQTSGDRVLAENYLQHAEHYFRLMRAMQPQRPISEIIGRDQFVSGYDIDFEDEGGGEAVETEAEGESEAAEPAGERPQRFEMRREEFRGGDQRPRDEASPRQDRFQSDRFGGERSREDRPREGGQRFGRDDRPRFNREDRQGRPERSERAERDPLGVIEPEATPLPSASPTAEAPILRADDGEVSHAPAFLQVRAAEPRGEGAEEGRRPRRRRAPASFTADNTEAPAGEGGDA